MSVYAGENSTRRVHVGLMAMAKLAYAPAPESRAIVDIASSYGLFIGGEFVDPIDGTPFKSVNPATEEVLAEVSAAGPADVDAAVAAARRAYTRVWSRMPGRDRGKYLFRIARILQERSRATRRAGVDRQWQADPGVP